MVKKLLRGLMSVFKKVRIKYLVIAVLVIAALGASYIFYFHKLFSSSKTSASLQFATVSKGDLNVAVSGSGPIESANSVSITPKVNGTVTKVFFKAGDKVKAGDLMYELDDSDAVLNVENIRNQIDQTKLTLNNNIKSINSLNVLAPFSGQISNITVKEGDSLQKGSAVMTITDESKLKLTVPFTGININDIKKGMKADVYLQNVMQAVEGTVSYVNISGYSNASGAQQYDVEVTVENPGLLKDGMKAGVELNTSDGAVTSSDVGTLEYVNSTIIKSDVGGTIEKLTVKEGEFVKDGASLVKILNDDLTISRETTDLKLKNLQSQLDAANKQVGYCKIYSEIDGVVVSQTATAGTVARSGDVLSTVSDSNHMQFDVSVDELDIAKIKAGQTASISVDALPETTNNPITGVVSEIALEGSPSNGVTTYPVTIKVNDNTNLKVGMNANADILVNQKQDVLFVPLQAIHKMGNRSYVLLKSDAAGVSTPGANTNAPGSFGGYGRGNWNGAGQGSSNDGNSTGQNGGTQDRSPNNQDNSQNNSGNSGSNSGNSRNNGNGQNNGNAGFDGNGPPAMMNGGYGPSNGYSGSGNNANRRVRSLTGNGQNSGTVMRFVEVGINNENYIEIVSGLNEGDQVALPVVASSSSNSNANNANRMMLGGLSGGGGGGFGGGFSGGMNGGSGTRSNNNSNNRRNN